MFKLDPNPTFTRTVEVMVPSDGGHRCETLTATFRVRNAEELEQHDLRSAQGTREFLEQIVERLDDIAGEDGKPLAYDDALRDRVLLLPYVRHALTRAYFEALAPAKRGN